MEGPGAPGYLLDTGLVGNQEYQYRVLPQFNVNGVTVLGTPSSPINYQVPILQNTWFQSFGTGSAKGPKWTDPRVHLTIFSTEILFE